MPEQSELVQAVAKLGLLVEAASPLTVLGKLSEENHPRAGPAGLPELSSRGRWKKRDKGEVVVVVAGVGVSVGIGGGCGCGIVDVVVVAAVVVAAVAGGVFVRANKGGFGLRAKIRGTAQVGWEVRRAVHRRHCKLWLALVQQRKIGAGCGAGCISAAPKGREVDMYLQD